VDGRLPGGGLPLGRWHEAGGEGLEAETGAVTGAFVAALAAPLAARGVVVWVMRRDDLYAPGLSNLGFPVARLIQVRVRDEAEALGALEDALASAGVAAAIGEAAGADLTQGRRLQLACEKHGATGFVIRRHPFSRPAEPARPGLPLAGAGSAAATRWSIAPSPSEPAPGEPGLGAPRWRVGLERCRGGRPGAWIMEKSDGPHPLRVVADLGDRQLETPPPFRLAG
jgi:protein ImuA